MSEVREIDVEEIMRRIRENIRQRRGPEGLPLREKRASPFDDGQGAVDYACLHAGYDIQHAPFSSHRWIVGPLVVAIKKALRRLLTPLLDRQVAYNVANVRVTTHIKEWLEALDCQYALVSGQIEALERSRAELQALASRTQLELQEIESNFLNSARFALRQSQALQEMGAELRAELRAETLAETLAVQSQALQEMGAELRAETLAAQSQALMRAELQAKILAAQSQAFQEMRAELRAESQAFQEMRAEPRAETPAGQSQALQEMRAQLRPELDLLEQHARTTKEGVSRTERKLRRILHFLGDRQVQDRQLTLNPVQDVPAVLDLEPEFDYAGFAERFRGSEEDIKERQRIYLPCFEGRENVIDIGCGRGEFLELLRENGITARGLDLDLDMVLLCREKGLEVAMEDAFTYLKGLPDDSVGGIIAAQVIEHIPPRRVIDLVKLCYRKLASGGCLVVETPNPKCLMVFADSFYKDPSHVQPVHPDTMQFVFEAVGFHEVELRFSAPVDPCMMIPSLQTPGADLGPFNQGLERLNTLLFGFQDYAVIGRKDVAPPARQGTISADLDSSEPLRGNP